MGQQLVYVTASSEEEARTIGRILVTERLAACVNIHTAHKSLYWWEGKVEEDTEVAFFAKTKEELVPRLVKRICALHSYDCPCVVAVPIVGGNPAFLSWIDQETE